MFKSIFTITLSLVFLITTIMAIVGAGRLVNTGLDVALGVETCTYRPSIERVEKESIEECSVDTNSQKRDVAGGLAMLLVALPISIFSYRKMRKS